MIVGRLELLPTRQRVSKYADKKSGIRDEVLIDHNAALSADLSILPTRTPRLALPLDRFLSKVRNHVDAMYYLSHTDPREASIA